MRRGEGLLPGRAAAREVDHARKPLAGRRILDRRQGEVARHGLVRRGRWSQARTSRPPCRGSNAPAAGGDTSHRVGSSVLFGALTHEDRRTRNRHASAPVCARRLADLHPMTTHSKRPRWPRGAGVLGKPAACCSAGRGTAGSARRAPPFVGPGTPPAVLWLARRLAAHRGRAARAGGAAGSDPRMRAGRRASRQDLADWEGCCMERAVLRARIRALAVDALSDRGLARSAPRLHCIVSATPSNLCAVAANRSTGHSPSAVECAASAASRWCLACAGGQPRRFAVGDAGGAEAARPTG